MPGEPDLLDHLIGASDPETGAGLDAADVRNNLTAFLLAGHETTALALTWAWYVLMDEPEVLETLRGGVDELPCWAATGGAYPAHVVRACR